MLMFLILVAASVIVGGASALLLAGVTRDTSLTAERPEARPQVREPSHFFVENGSRPATSGPPIPIEILVSQIDGHVRLEQAAMEAFLEAPNVQSLHSRTTSTLVN